MGIERDSLFVDSLHSSATLTMTGAYWGNGIALVLTVGQENFPLIKINSSRDIWAVAFVANGEYLFTGDDEGVCVWRVEDGKQTVRMETRSVVCFAVSKDGRWIAAGTAYGDVIVWDAKTHKKVSSHSEGRSDINGVDFSPDSTRLVSASGNGTASIWDVETCKRVQTLAHRLAHPREFEWLCRVNAAKYSPQGDRIATATLDSVVVWDTNDGRLLVNIKVTVTPWYNTGLLWFNNNLFVVSDGKIKQIEASTGSAVSEWPVPDSNEFSCIALPGLGESIAYSTQCRHILGYGDTYPARSHPTPSRHTFNRSLTRPPLSRN